MKLSFSIIPLIFILSETASSVDPLFETCRLPKSCGDNQTIRYPFYIQGQQEPFCGYYGFMLKCHRDGRPILQLSGRDYLIHQIFYETQSLRVSDAGLSTDLSCLPPIKNLSLPRDRFELAPEQTELYLIYNCSGVNLRFDRNLEYRSVCDAVAVEGRGRNLENVIQKCGKAAIVVAATVEIQGEWEGSGGAVAAAVRRGFVLKWKASDCRFCRESGGICGFDEGNFHFKCYCPNGPHAWRCSSFSGAGGGKKNLKIALGIGIPVVLLSVSALVIGLLYSRKRLTATNFLARSISHQLHSKSDLDGGQVYFEVPIFSYFELEKATNKFARDKELGHGGFGAVYHGKLHDGREVAVKRLYRQSDRLAEQFMNEVKILTRLRHKNLVSLYGCSSSRSHEHLLVYEFIPNGTIADHLHGQRANPSLLTWPIRMAIAIETASALAYLHASDIVHRDVKTNNILLEDNFSVKVADFGISRLFPNNVSHISTAPQGTFGYIDPQYFYSFQLTTKSDVYAFGVVLLELISSMPAVDANRQSNEIGLINFARNRIQNQEVDKLIDPQLWCQSDNEVQRMITSVARLAFQCLQEDKEKRPTMEEALEALKRMESGREEPDNEEDDCVLLNKFKTSSPG